MKYLITGLGNKGDEYANTRHNIGFIILDAFAKDGKAAFTTDKYADIASLKYKGRTFILVKPNTFMNFSGKAVNYWQKKENIPMENLLIVADDIALPSGVLRMKPFGGDGGHNGLIHIIETLGTNRFPRLRFGIGDDFPKGYQSEYVLGKWTKQEETDLIPRIELAVDMIKSYALIGIEKTMTAFNNK